MTRALARLALARADFLDTLGDALKARAERIVTVVQHKYGAHYHLTESGGLVREPGPQFDCSSPSCQAVAEAERAAHVRPERF